MKILFVIILLLVNTNFLLSSNRDLTAEEIQNKVYAIGMSLGIELKSWFGAIYQVLLGQNEGPRVGSFKNFMESKI